MGTTLKGVRGDQFFYSLDGPKHHGLCQEDTKPSPPLLPIAFCLLFFMFLKLCVCVHGSTCGCRCVCMYVYMACVGQRSALGVHCSTGDIHLLSYLLIFKDKVSHWPDAF